MTFFRYVDRQKQRIRDRHASEEIVTLGGENLVRGGDFLGGAECAERAEKEIERLFSKLDGMRGLNKNERARFARRTADAV